MLPTDLGMLVTYNPSVISPEMTIEELLERLQTSSFHHWPVVNDQHQLVGIFSDENLIQAVGQRAAILAADGAASFPHDHDRCRIQDWMTSHVVTISLETPPAAALQLLLQHGFHSLPVVGEQNQLVAILTSTDFLREFSYSDHPVCRQTVSQLLIKTTDFIETKLSLDDAKIQIELAEADYLPVLQGECPLGVIGRRDLRIYKCREMANAARNVPGFVPATMAALVKSSPTLRPGDHLAKAAGLMVEHGVQAVAVVNHGNHLIGIVSDHGVLAAMHEHFSLQATGAR